MKNGLSTITLNQILTAALTGQPYNQRRLGDHMKLYALRISMRRAWWLPVDLHDEIAQEAFVDLWQNKAAHLAGKTAKRAFRDCVVKATRTIQADYAAPGKRTRAYTKVEPSHKVAPEQIGFIAGLIDSSTDASADVSWGYADAKCPTSAAEQTAVDAKIDLQVILRTAPTVVRTALELVYFEGKPKREAAAVLKISRFALARKIDTFCEAWRQAA